MEQAPSERIGKSEEIASAVLFLAPEDSGFVDGIELFVDGGMIRSDRVCRQA